MRVLHSFRERVGPVVVRRQGALEFDFSKVWIDACSFQQLHQETRNAHEIEAWLDRNYAGHFMEGLDDSVIVAAVRRRLAGHAAHAISDAKDIAARAGDLQTLRRLEERWQALFPTVFSTQVA